MSICLITDGEMKFKSRTHTNKSMSTVIYLLIAYVTNIKSLHLSLPTTEQLQISILKCF